jgi:hypothetical protein
MSELGKLATDFLVFILYVAAVIVSGSAIALICLQFGKYLGRFT